MKRIPGSSRSAAITPQSCTPGSPNTTRTPSLKSCFTSASPPVIRAISGLLPTEHDVADHEGQQGNNIPDSRFGTGENVVRQDDEVRALAGLERAEVRLLPRRPRVPRGEGAHGLGARHPLLGLPARVRTLARPPRDRRVDAGDGARVFPREVRAAGDARARAEQRAPRVRAAQALGAEALGRPAHLGRAVCRLHAREHAEPGEARDVALGQDLRVLDPRAEALRLAGSENLLKGVEGERVRAVADRVDADLEAAGRRLAGEAVELVRRDQQEPAVVRVVAVARVQRGAARAERAVEPELQRADDEPPVALARGAALTPLGPRLLAAHRDVVAERNPPALEETPVRRERVEVGARLLEAREPLRETLGDRLADGAVEALRGRWRQHGAYEVLRRIHEDPRRPPRRVLQATPARPITGAARPPPASPHR